MPKSEWYLFSGKPLHSTLPENVQKTDENKIEEENKQKKEKTEKEKEEAKRTKHDLFSEKRKQQQEIKTLKVLLKLKIISQNSAKQDMYWIFPIFFSSKWNEYNNSNYGRKINVVRCSTSKQRPQLRASLKYSTYRR